MVQALLWLFQLIPLLSYPENQSLAADGPRSQQVESILGPLDQVLALHNSVVVGVDDALLD
jgi:hypothetical protein